MCDDNSLSTDNSAGSLESFRSYLAWASQVVDSWPQWKRDICTISARRAPDDLLDY